MSARLTLNPAGMDSPLSPDASAALTITDRRRPRQRSDAQAPRRSRKAPVLAGAREKEVGVGEPRVFVVGVPAGRYRLMEVAMAPELSRRLGLLVRDCGHRISIAELVDALLARHLPGSADQAGGAVRDYLTGRVGADVAVSRRLRLPECTRTALDALVGALSDDHPAWKVNRSVVIAAIITAHLPDQPAHAIAACDELRLARLKAD